MAGSSIASQYYQIYTPQPISCFFIPFTLNGDDDDDLECHAREGFLIVRFLRDALHRVFRPLTLIVVDQRDHRDS